MTGETGPMLALGVHLTGEAELQFVLGHLADDVRGPVMQPVIERAGRPMVQRARQLVRVDTGALRDSIGLVRGAAGDDKAEVFLTAGGGLPDDRATFNEFGTSRMAAQPYLRPAIQEGRGDFFEDLAAGFWEQLRKRHL